MSLATEQNKISISLQLDELQLVQLTELRIESLIVNLKYMRVYDKCMLILTEMFDMLAL